MTLNEKTHIILEGEIAARFKAAADSLGVDLETLGLMAVSGFLNSPLIASLSSRTSLSEVSDISPQNDNQITSDIDSTTGKIELREKALKSGGLDFQFIIPTGELAPENEYILWGQFNRFLPIKFTLRVLARLILESGNGEGESWTSLDKWFAEVWRTAPTVRKDLGEIDFAQNTPRGEQLTSGFPTNTDKSINRFVNHFCADVYRDGKIVGFPSHLGLIKGSTDRNNVSLTDAGLQYVMLDNPILDGPLPYDSTMSMEEVGFMVKQIQSHLPSTWEFMIFVLNSVNGGLCTPDQLSEAIETNYGYGSQKNWNLAQISTYRTGAIGLLGDMSLIERKRDGRRVSYSLTKNGERELED